MYTCVSKDMCAHRLLVIMNIHYAARTLYLYLYLCTPSAGDNEYSLTTLNSTCLRKVCKGYAIVICPSMCRRTCMCVHRLLVIINTHYAARTVLSLYLYLYLYSHLCLYLCVYMYLCASSAGDNEHSLSCQDCITASQFKLPAPIPATFLSCTEPLHFPSPPVSFLAFLVLSQDILLNVIIIVIRASQLKLPAPILATFLSFSTILKAILSCPTILVKQSANYNGTRCFKRADCFLE